MSGFDFSPSRMIEFDEKAHRYTVDGAAHPSVSHILAELGISEKFDGVNAGLLAYRASRGKRIHLASQYYSQGVLDLESVAPEERPFVDAVIAFHNDFPRWKSLMRERRFYVKCFDDEERGELGYCGTIDDIMLLAPGRYEIRGRVYNIGEDEIGLFDDKTSTSLAPSYRYQVGGGYLRGVAEGLDGDDLDMSLTQTISALIGRPVRKVHCFIRHLRPGHYFLVPINEEETYTQWEQLLRKFFYPRTKLDVEKMVRNQIDMPEAIARRLARIKFMEDAIKPRKAAAREEAVKLLTRDGMEFNGVAEIGGRKITFSKSFGGYSESIDDAAFVTKLLAWEKPSITMQEVHALRASCKVSGETEGTWRLNVGKAKVVESAMASMPKTISETKVPEPPKSSVKSESVAETTVEMKAETKPEMAKTAEVFVNEEGKGVLRVHSTPVDAADAVLPTEIAPILAPDTAPIDFTIPKALVDDLREVANRVFPRAIIRRTENETFKGWSFSTEFEHFLMSLDMLVPINSWTEGMAKNLIEALIHEEVRRDEKKREQTPRSANETLADVLIRTVMTAYGIEKLDAQNKVVDFCRATNRRSDFTNLCDSDLRDLINEMGKAAANEMLARKDAGARKEAKAAAPEGAECVLSDGGRLQPQPTPAPAPKPPVKPEPKPKAPTKTKTKKDDPKQPGLFD
jgi:hypothetical protein